MSAASGNGAAADPNTPEFLRAQLADVGYVADSALACALFLAERLQRPVLLEGEAGVGKTAVARALAKAGNRELIRLQCYEGLDAQNALYEWNYQKQLLAIRLGEKPGGKEMSADSIFAPEFLLERPLLAALRRERSPVLLVDEIDRADEEFEAYLLEALSEFQITVPELGVIRARARPFVVLTSNSTRALSDALRRRCLYCRLDYPDEEKELQILRAQMPDIDAGLAAQAARFVRLLRNEDLEKKPGIAETLDWVAALLRLNIGKLDSPAALARLRHTLPCLLKTAADTQAVPAERARLLAQQAG